MQPKPSRNAPRGDAAASERHLLDQARALHAAVSDLVRVYQVRDREQICCHDISVTQCWALEALAARGAMRSQSLADVLMLDKSTVTRVVDALVRKGYVARTADPDDRRAVSLCVTPEGRALYERIDGELIAQQAALVRDLDPQVRAGAVDLVRRLARAAEARLLGGGAGCAPADCGPAGCD